MNNLIKINIRNYTCYYFDDIIKIQDFDFDSILFDEKSYENILVYDISHKFDWLKTMFTRLEKVDGFIRVYDGTRYLVLFGPEKYDAIYNRSTYLIS